MTITDYNNRLNPPQVAVMPDHMIRSNVNYGKIAQIRRYYDINGMPSHYQLKRQLAKTRHLCRTIINGQVVKL